MVKIRLKRLGRKKAPFYRIVAIDSRERRQGAPIMELGWYNPLTDDFQFNRKQVLHFLKTGAQPTSTVAGLMKKAQL